MSLSRAPESLQLWGYTCPECDERTHSVEGVQRETSAGELEITVKCPECGNVERFIRGGLAA